MFFSFHLFIDFPNNMHALLFIDFPRVTYIFYFSSIFPNTILVWFYLRIYSVPKQTTSTTK